MTTTDLQVDDGIGAYLNRLETAPVAPAERDELVVEIRAHIHDSVSGTSDPNGATEPVFRLLGTPEELALRYLRKVYSPDAGCGFSGLALAAHQLATGQGRDHGNDDFLRCIIWLCHRFGACLRCIPEALFAFDDWIVVGVRGLRRRRARSSGNAARTSGPVVCAGNLSCGFSGGDSGLRRRCAG